MCKIYYVNQGDRYTINPQSFPHKKACFFGFTQGYPHSNITKQVFEEVTKTAIISQVYIKCTALSWYNFCTVLLQDFLHFLICIYLSFTIFFMNSSVLIKLGRLNLHNKYKESSL